MKILQIGCGNNPGGVEAFVMNYYRQLSQRGVSFDFLCMYEKISYEKEILALGGKIFYVPNVKKDYFGYVKQLRRILKQENYDAVHVNMLSAANMVPLRLAHEAGVKKIIAHSHNASAPGLLRKSMDFFNRPRLGRYATQFLACGEKAGRWLFGDQAYDAGKVLCVSNAISVEQYLFSQKCREQIRRQLGVGEEKLIGHIGRFDVQKNHRRIIEIFRKVLESDPHAKLCLIGDGGLREHIREQVKKAGIEENVIFAGVCSNIREYLSAMDVFLFPSLFEGLPFTLLEVQANGLPAVISDTITEEAVVLPECVQKVSLEESDDIWAAAVKNSGERKTDAAVIREKLAAAHFDIEKEAEKLLDLYNGEQIKAESAKQYK